MFRKEKEFVKKANEELKEEVTISRIEILDFHENGGKVAEVKYKDKYGRTYKVSCYNGRFKKKEILKW